MRVAFLACTAVMLAGCGYVGDPLPPALNIPGPVKDLRAMQRGDTLVLDFTAPALTTDEIGLTTISAVEAMVGSDAVVVPPPKPGAAAHVEIPARQWMGTEVAVRVILAGPKGQASRESNSVKLRVEEALRPPTAINAEPHREGLRVAWTASDPRATGYRIVREPDMQATADKAEYIDRATEAGKEYKYVVIALRQNAESLPSASASAIPRDIFAPAAPANLTAIAGVGSIELAWDRSPEADLKTYRVYRNDAVLMQDLGAPSASDKQIVSGQSYRYAVSAVDQAGNESPKSAVAEIMAP